MHLTMGLGEKKVLFLKKFVLARLPAGIRVGPRPALCGGGLAKGRRLFYKQAAAYLLLAAFQCLFSLHC
jgi:hypothetical protein